MATKVDIRTTKTTVELDAADKALLVREAQIRRSIANLEKRKLGDEEKKRLALLVGPNGLVQIPNGYLPGYLGATVYTKTKTDVDTKRLIAAYARVTGQLETEVKAQFEKTSGLFLTFDKAE